MLNRQALLVSETWLVANAVDRHACVLRIKFDTYLQHTKSINVFSNLVLIFSDVCAFLTEVTNHVRAGCNIGQAQN